MGVPRPSIEIKSANGRYLVIMCLQLKQDHSFKTLPRGTLYGLGRAPDRASAKASAAHNLLGQLVPDCNNKAEVGRLPLPLLLVPLEP